MNADREAFLARKNKPKSSDKNKMFKSSRSPSSNLDVINQAIANKDVNLFEIGPYQVPLGMEELYIIT
jgi:hypothetical protein